jgi:trk system potassium uptake protein TrkH
MHWRAIIRLFGILLLLYSLSFYPSLAVALFYDDGQWAVFAASALIAVAAGCLLWWPNRRYIEELSLRDGFLVVTLFWLLLGVVGALPFMLGLHLDVTDAIFESISGFTTTGATILREIESLPRSVLYHRQQIQWLGGMGIIVLAIAVLPLLGVGGMQLYRAEASGVTKHEKPAPRIAQTARLLWLIYLLLTVACALCYLLAGMLPFDAIAHAYTTVATGGFSTHSASLAHYDSALIEAVAIVFMLAGGVNFAIHFLAWHRRTPLLYLRDPEARTFLVIFLALSVLTALSLSATGYYADALESLRYAAFQNASVLTSTGFTTATFASWPLHVPLLLVIASFIGGCGGSTAGGIKVMRVMLLARLGVRQLFQLAHPQAITVTKLGGRLIDDEALFAIWGFFVLYISTTTALTVGMMACGLDLESAFGAVMATINLLGPGLGSVAEHFADVNEGVKWLAIIGMLAGRLEIFTLLILLLPSYWRH